MKQLNITSLLIVLLSMIGLNASAHDIEVKNGDGVTIYYNYVNNGTELSVTYRSGSNYSLYSNRYSGNVVIPESVAYDNKTYSVTSIDYGAFSGCSDLTSIIIPESVTSIGPHAFNSCSGLNSIIIPESVTSIGSYAFSGCSGLTSVTIPNNVTSINNGAFSGCSGLTSIKVKSGNITFDSRNNCNAIIETATNILVAGCKKTIIPNSVTGIGNEAFYHCSELTSISISNSVTSIGIYAFNDCSNLTSIIIPENVTSIGSEAFGRCTNLNSIKVAAGNTKYDSRDNSNAIIETATNIMVAGCNKTIIPNSVTSVGNGAFSGCSNLTSVYIPSSVTSIGGRAFHNCSGLTSVTIPNSVTTVSASAFEGCSSLISITIPESVTNIGYGAFEGCSALKKVYNEATSPQKLSSNPYFNYTTATLHVPAGTKELYQAADYWKNFSKIIEDINTVTVEDDKEPATIVEGEKFYILLLDKEIVKYAEKISTNEAGKGRFAIKDGGLLIVKGDDVRFALSEIKKGDILVFDFVGKIRCLYGTLTANAAQQNSFPLVTGDEMELESGKEYIANDDCDVVIEMETTESPVELKSITITEPTGVSIVENSTSNPPSGKTYNLSGQQVNANSNGLLIQDGKKIIKQ